MSDWPVLGSVEKCVLNTASFESSVGQFYTSTSGGLAAAVWPTANLAIYTPVKVQTQCTVYKLSFQVGVQSGNYDIGIYDEAGNQIVAKGSTAVPVAGIALVDIADTTLTPGLYFFALCIDNITATVNRMSFTSSLLRTLGVQAQALASVTLPNPATFSTPTATLVPVIHAHLVATA